MLESTSDLRTLLTSRSPFLSNSEKNTCTWSFRSACAKMETPLATSNGDPRLSAETTPESTPAFPDSPSAQRPTSVPVTVHFRFRCPQPALPSVHSSVARPWRTPEHRPLGANLQFRKPRCLTVPDGSLNPSILARREVDGPAIGKGQYRGGEYDR